MMRGSGKSYRHEGWHAAGEQAYEIERAAGARHLNLSIKNVAAAAQTSFRLFATLRAPLQGVNPPSLSLTSEEDHASTTVVVLHVDRHIAGGELLVVGRPRPHALCQHVRRSLELELDVNDSDGKSENTRQRLVKR